MTHIAHHQVGAFGIAPIIVEGDDIRVLQAGDYLRFCFKAANKLRVVGVLAPDNLDRYLAPDARLDGTMDGAVGALANLLLQFITAHARRRRGVQVQLAGQNLLVQFCRPGRGRHAQLFGQHAAARRVCGNSLLPAAAQRQHLHQLPVTALAQVVNLQLPFGVCLGSGIVLLAPGNRRQNAQGIQRFAAEILAPGLRPILKFVAVVQIEVGQEVAAVKRRCPLQVAPAFLAEVQIQMIVGLGFSQQGLEQVGVGLYPRLQIEPYLPPRGSDHREISFSFIYGFWNGLAQLVEDLT